MGFLVLPCTGWLHAQFTFDHGNFQKGRGFITAVDGRKPDTAVYEQITSGSPWWYDFFIPADLADGEGRVYEKVPVKIDLLADKVYYKDSSGALFELLTPIKYLRAWLPGKPDTLKMVHSRYYTLHTDRSLSGWMELHLLGEATLLRHPGKKMQEQKGFSSAVADYTVETQPVWLVALDFHLYPVKKAKDLQQLLARYKPALGAYTPAQKGLEAQAKELVTAFNRL